MKALEIEGRWHIDGEDQPAHYGTLVCDPMRGLQLDVKDIRVKTSIDNMMDRVNRQRPTASETIQGFDACDRPVRLFDCIDTGGSFAQGLTTHIRHVTRAVHGLNHGEWLTITSKSFGLRFSLSQYWMGSSNNQPRREVVKCVVNDEFTFVIYPTQRVGLNNGERFSPWIELEFKNEVRVAEVESRHCMHLALFFCLATGCLVIMDEFRFKSTEIPNSGQRYLEVFARNAGDDGRIDRQCIPLYLRTTFEEMEPLLQHMISEWFKFRESQDMQQVVYIYGSVKSQHLFTSVEFLLIAQALEAYHTASNRYSSTKWERADFEAMKNRVRKALDKDDLTKLQANLMNANSKSFQDKLVDVLGDAPPQILKIIPNPAEFAKDVKDNRNAHTHHVGKQSHSKRFGEYVLHGLAHEAMALLEMVLLRDIGAPEKALDHIVSQHLARVRIEIKGIES